MREAGFGTVVFALAASAVALAGQEPSFRSPSSEVVVVPVTVTDRQGRLVADLSAAQFSVYDNDRRQPITLFSNDDTPVTVGLVLDTSASMRPKMGEVVAATSAFARSSNPADELFTLAFNDDVHDAVGDHPFLRASDATTLEATVSAFAADGRTALYDALIAGLDRLDTGTRPRKVLILISDGGDNASQATLDQVLARARRSNAAIYTVGLFTSDDPDANPRILKSISTATGGERYLPATPGALIQTCMQIAREIRSGYTIGYEPPDRDGRYHRLRVDLNAGRRLTVRTRPGYFAASAE
jgi:VWFA-related protein